MNKIVTDGQMGQFAKRQHELMTRVKKGTVPFKQAFDGLQVLIEGGVLTNPGTYRTFSIKIGGATPDELRWLMNRRGVSHWTLSAIESSDFITSATEWSIDLIILTPRDFGFTIEPEAYQLLDSNFLAMWSGVNQTDKILGLCPSEVGPQLADQFDDFLTDESVLVAMKPISGIEGIPVIFLLDTVLKFPLKVTRSYPFYKLDLDQQIIFQLMPKPKES